MPLKYRFTTSGKQKQQRDEFVAWQALVANANGTPSHAGLVAITTAGAGGVVTAIATTSPLYLQWIDAHRSATLRARSDRQREQAAVSAGTPVPNDSTGAVLPCLRITPALRVRDTIRMVLLHAPTLEDYGGGTRLSAATTKATTAQLHQFLDTTLASIEGALRSPATHRDEHDLRAAGRPPVQVFLASEWYFRMPGRPYSQLERDAIVTDLTALSRKYPEWLLVPGSIYWSPDDVAAPPVRVYNEAPVLFAGSLITTRIKRESHDIDGDRGDEHRWGPDYPRVTGGATPHPVALVASMAPCIFTLNGRVFCVEICRDHSVGDAVEGLLASGTPTGADIYLFTSNGTTLDPKFLPLRDDGIGAWCDGSGGGNTLYFRATRVTALNHTPAPMAAYRAAFDTERNEFASLTHAADETVFRERHPSADFTTFMARYDAVFGAAPSTDVPLKTATDLAVGVIAPIAGALGAYQPKYKMGLRIQQLLATGFLPTGTAITPAEILEMTPYSTDLVNIGVNALAVIASKLVTGPLKTTALGGFDTVKVDLTPGAAVVPAVFSLKVYNLVDLL